MLMEIKANLPKIKMKFSVFFPMIKIILTHLIPYLKSYEQCENTGNI